MPALRILLSSLALLLAPMPAGSAPDAASPILLAPGVELFPGQLQAGRSPDGNSVLLQGEHGAVLVDSGRGGAHTQRLLERLARGAAPLRALINTHWHLDHIGGNARMRAAFPGLRIFAHPSLDTALAGFHADSRRQLQAYLPTLPADSPDQVRYRAELELLDRGPELAATDAVDGAMVMDPVGRPLELRLASQAVTEGDLMVFDRRSGLLLVGDLVTLPVPLFDTACPERWAAALRDLDDQRFVRLVPGHGPVLERGHLRRYRRGVERLLACAARSGTPRECADGWFADTGALMPGGDTAYARDLLAYYQQQALRPGAPGRERWCR